MLTIQLFNLGNLIYKPTITTLVNRRFLYPVIFHSFVHPVKALPVTEEIVKTE